MQRKGSYKARFPEWAEDARKAWDSKLSAATAARQSSTVNVRVIAGISSYPRDSEI
jgi:hypothetical protein